jgi:hypothetical protein
MPEYGAKARLRPRSSGFEHCDFCGAETRLDSDGLRACGTYKLCLDDPDFLQFASECRKRQVEQIDQERSFRKNERYKKKAARLLPVKTLSNG